MIDTNELHELQSWLTGVKNNRSWHIDPKVIANELDAMRAEVAKLMERNRQLRELLDELSTTGAKSVAMVGTSGPGVTITTGLALTRAVEALV